MTDTSAADVEEAGGGEKPADRSTPELRRRRRGSMVRKAERRGMLLEMRAKPDGTGGTTFVFDGYGSTFDEPFEMWDPWGDPYTEVVRQGAFSRSLGRADLDVPFLIGHNEQGIPLARTRNGTMKLSQDTHGLAVWAEMDGGRSDVRNLASAVERGDLDEMSIGFVTMGQEWSPDWETRAMTDLELHRGDVSAVALAANPGTAGATMISLASGRPLDRRAQAEITDLSSSPDFNLSANGHGALKCPYTKANGCGKMNAATNTFCGSCGGPLYDSDGSIVLDDSGVTEEVGASGDADLLSRRLRLLELA
jgi:HK97 family phage prohead protease